MLRSTEDNQQGRLQQLNEQLEQQEKLAYDLAVERREQDEQMKRKALQEEHEEADRRNTEQRRLLMKEN